MRCSALTRGIGDGFLVMGVSPTEYEEPEMHATAIHIRTRGLKCQGCTRLVRKALKQLPGVMDVVAVESMQLTSVLYDQDRIATETMRRRIQECGFTAEPLR